MWTSFFGWLIQTVAGAIIGKEAESLPEHFKLGYESLIQGGLHNDMSIVDIVGGGGGSTTFGIGLPAKKKRRRRARLTQSELTELMQIKNLLGKTAAANVLPYYMGRGR